MGVPHAALALGSSSNGTGRAGPREAAGTMCAASFSPPKLIALPDPGQGGESATSAQFPFVWANPRAPGLICRFSSSSPQRSGDKSQHGAANCVVAACPIQQGIQFAHKPPQCNLEPQLPSEGPPPSSPAVRRWGGITASAEFPGEELPFIAQCSPA